MALRVYKNRKERSNKPVAVYCPLDEEAFDKDAIDVEKYIETLDAGLLIWREGQQGESPIFHVQPLTHAQYRTLRIAAQREAERVDNSIAARTMSAVLTEGAFFAGCTRVGEVTLVHENGDESKGDLPRERWQGTLDTAWIQWLGLLIIEMSKEPLPPAKPTEPDVGKP